jgi:hypothetical protein
MNQQDQKRSYKHLSPRQYRILKGFAIGTFCGAVIASGMTVLTLGLSSFSDTSPSIIGGTQRSGSFFITFSWGVIGAAGGAIFGVVISLPRNGKVRLIIAGALITVIAAICLALNTALFL